MKHAQSGVQVTFGVVPNRVETGYGYIQAAEAAHGADDSARPVARFVEKPDYEMNSVLSGFNNKLNQLL